MEATPMKTEREQLTLPLECYDSGELQIFTMREAVDRLLAVNYGFLAPGNKITWCVNGHKGWNNVYKIAGEKPTCLGLNTYACHGQPYTIDDAEAQINGHRELGKELFVAWAARFNLAFRENPQGQALPKDVWPFRYVKVFSNRNGSLMRPAYQMGDHRSSFVIAGVDRDQVDASVVPNWALLWREFLRKWQR
jgi:hypothetical protein